MKKSARPAKRKSRMEAPNPERYIVQMEKLTSSEVYLDPDGGQTPVLHDLNLEIERGQCWGVVGLEPFELELMLEIVGCVRPYGSGRCKLVERGMMRKKRKILPHVFFVGDGEMSIPNMSALEYLMFATQNTGISAKVRQIEFLKLLLDSDCYAWTFAPVAALTRAQKSVLSLVAATFSGALLIIFSCSRLQIEPPLQNLIRLSAQRVTAAGGAVLMSTQSAELAQSVCTHAAFLINGTLTHSGTLSVMMRELDKREYIVKTEDVQALKEQLRTALPCVTCMERKPYLDLYNMDEVPLAQAKVLDVLAALHDVRIDTIRYSKKTLENAFLEASGEHDL
ncbi:MAG: hypothetical protein RSA55_03130 [Clostridia bacterium]